jgi:hypothetical protein
MGELSSPLHNVEIGPGAHPASYPMGARGKGYFLGGDADHSPPTSVEIKNSGAIPPHCLIKHKDSFTFYLTSPFLPIPYAVG